MPNPNLKIEITVRVNDSTIPLRCAFQAKPEDIADALQAIKTNDSPEMDFIEGVRPMENTVIATARQQIAEAIAHDITSYLVHVEFAKNDTHNGYKKSWDGEA